MPQEKRCARSANGRLMPRSVISPRTSCSLSPSKTKRSATKKASGCASLSNRSAWRRRLSSTGSPVLTIFVGTRSDTLPRRAAASSVA